MMKKGPPKGGHSVLILIVASVVAVAAQQSSWTAPRTAWGDPDFDGIWNYPTMTPLERPREVADKAVLTPAEAAAYEKRTVDRQATANNTAGPAGGIQAHGTSPADAPRSSSIRRTAAFR
jgi:hypothetical protein